MDLFIFFPRGQKGFNEIKNKFLEDLQGLSTNDPEQIGIVFVTNQEMKLVEREELIKQVSENKADIFHLERLATILNSPLMYGVRLEFLDIEMTKEEQLAHLEAKNREL